jgi:hypothetical protein
MHIRVQKVTVMMNLLGFHNSVANQQKLSCPITIIFKEIIFRKIELSFDIESQNFINLG